MIARIVNKVLTVVGRWTGGERERYATRSVGAVVLIGLLMRFDVQPQQVVNAGIAAAERVVEQLRELPTPLPHVGIGVHAVGQPPPIPQSEVIRDTAYRELHRMGPAGVTVLARAYDDPDVRLRRNVALAFLVLAEGIWPELPKLDVSAALPDLTAALADDDPDVRAWSAQAIGEIGPEARSAVPALIRLLVNRDEGSRNSACIALRGIGPAAISAIPALRRALSDRSEDVRRFAERAILAIEG